MTNWYVLYGAHLQNMDMWARDNSSLSSMSKKAQKTSKTEKYKTRKSAQKACARLQKLKHVGKDFKFTPCKRKNDWGIKVKYIDMKEKSVTQKRKTYWENVYRGNSSKRKKK